MKQVSKKQIVSKLRDVFRVEALESRVLLSADPILGQAALLAPDLLARQASRYRASLALRERRMDEQLAFAGMG